MGDLNMKGDAYLFTSLIYIKYIFAYIENLLRSLRIVSFHNHIFTLHG